MPTWEAKKTRSWKIGSRGSFKDFSQSFHRTVENDITPYLKESFLRLLAESKDSRMNQVEVSIGIKGRKLSKVM
jgi:hypothetical protein